MPHQGAETDASTPLTMTTWPACPSGIAVRNERSEQVVGSIVRSRPRDRGGRRRAARRFG
jgi:hypothetical protein